MSEPLPAPLARKYTLEEIVRMTTVLVAVLGLAVTAAQYFRTQQIEAARPYLERKLKWCEEATEVAAAIANGPPQPGRAKVERFWQLYWGVMGMVEGSTVLKAMKKYGDALPQASPEDLKRMALDIALACRGEMARDWSPVWGR